MLEGPEEENTGGAVYTDPNKKTAGAVFLFCAFYAKGWNPSGSLSPR